MMGSYLGGLSFDLRDIGVDDVGSEGLGEKHDTDVHELAHINSSILNVCSYVIVDPDEDTKNLLDHWRGFQLIV